MSSYDAWNLADHVAARLAFAGYSLHARKADSEDPCRLGEGEVFWFAWTDGRCDVEVGEDRDDELAAWADALDHHLSNATIRTGESLAIANVARDLLQHVVFDEEGDLSRADFDALVGRAEAVLPVQNVMSGTAKGAISPGYDDGHGHAAHPSPRE